MAAGNPPLNPRYEPHERPPWPVGAALSLQSAVIGLGHIVFYPLVVTQAAGLDAAHAAWILFASLTINGLTTIFQTVRLGWFGSGCILISIPSTVSVPFCILALLTGGPGTLASLVIVSALFQIAVTARLSLLRRLVTPTVDGTIMMLTVVTLLPIMLGQVNDVPEGTSQQALWVCAAATFVPMIAILVRSTGSLRLWSPVVAIGLGSAAAVAYGIYDFDLVRDARWVGFPADGWPGLMPQFGSAFWTLLPVFLFLAVVSVAKNNSLALNAQRVSRRNKSAINFREVQGGVLSSGVGSLVSGIIGGLPTYIGTTSSAVVLQTGCASRVVGVMMGGVILALAFFPKAWGLLAAVPGPVAGVYLAILTAPLFVEGLRTVAQDEHDYRRSLIVGIAVAIGLGFEFEVLSLNIEALWAPVLQKGLTAGGITVIVLSLYMQLFGASRRRLRTGLDPKSLPEINSFIGDFCKRQGWDEELKDRMAAVAEETVMVLCERDEGREEKSGGRKRRLTVLAGGYRHEAELEFISSPTDSGNLEDRIALIRNSDPGTEDLSAMERDVSLRLLQHYASSVSHRQYQETEVITVRIAPANG